MVSLPTLIQSFPCTRHEAYAAVQFNPLTLNLPPLPPPKDGGYRLTLRPGRFTAVKRAPDTHWILGWISPWVGEDATDNQPRFLGCSTCSTVTVLTALPWLVCPAYSSHRTHWATLARLSSLQQSLYSLSYPSSSVQPAAVTVLTELPTAHSQSPRPATICQLNKLSNQLPFRFLYNVQFLSHIFTPLTLTLIQYTVAPVPPYGPVRRFCTSLQVV